MARHLFEYRHQGADWALEIEADSVDDAKERLKALTWARYNGEIRAKVRVPGGGILLWLRSLLSR